MDRRFFLRAIAGSAVALSATALIGTPEALAKPLDAPVGNETAAADMPAAEAQDSYWVWRRPRRRRIYWRRRRVVFYRRRYRRVRYIRRRRWWW